MATYFPGPARTTRFVPLPPPGLVPGTPPGTVAGGAPRPFSPQQMTEEALDSSARLERLLCGGCGPEAVVRNIEYLPLALGRPGGPKFGRKF